MSLTMNIPASIEAQVAKYAKETGTSLESMFVDYLRERCLSAQKAKGPELIRRLRTIRERQPALTGAPYVFRREDAYEDEAR